PPRGDGGPAGPRPPGRPGMVRARGRGDAQARAPRPAAQPRRPALRAHDARAVDAGLRRRRRPPVRAPLRVLIVSDVSPAVVLGGAERVIWEQARRLAAR